MDENTEEIFFESPYLVTFFNLFFYFNLIPFKTVLDKSGKYTLRTSKAHEVVCGIAHVATFIFINYVTLVGVGKIRSSDSSSIVAILDCASNVGSTFSIMVLLFTLWKQRDLCLQVFEVTKCKFKSKRKLRGIHILVCLGSMFIVLFFWCLGWFLLEEHYSYGYSAEFSSNGELLVNVLKHINGEKEEIGNNSVNNTTEPDLITENVNNDSFLQQTHCNNTNSSGVKAFLGILQYCVYMYLSVFYFVTQGMFFTLVLTLREMGKEFSMDMTHHCMKEGADGVEKGIKIYRKLKNATDLIRDIYGNAMLGFYFSAVAYLAEAPNVLMGKRGETEKMVLLYFTVTSLMWLIAAEFHSTVRITVAKWVEFHSDSGNTSHDNRLRLHTISGEVSSHDTIALSNKFFPVTYAFMGSGLSLIATYGLIVFQLHQDQK